MFAQRIEESLCIRPVEAGGLPALECSEHLVLLRKVELHEGLAVRRIAIGLELGEPMPVELLLIGITPASARSMQLGDPGIERAWFSGSADDPARPSQRPSASPKC